MEIMESEESAEGGYLVIIVFIRWFWNVVCYHGWWRIHPKEWAKIKQTKDKMTQMLVNYELLPDMYARQGRPIHHITCKSCGGSWYTTCKKDLCRNINCWIKYYG
jgi:hypothetical protein